MQTDGIRLGDMTYRVIAPLEWKAKVANADWADIAAMPWIMMPENSAHHQVLSEAFGKHGLEPQKVIETDQASVIADLVASGVGLSLAREEIALAGRDAGRWVIWEPAHLEISLWFVYMPDRARDLAVQALVQGISEVWAEPVVPPVALVPRTAAAGS